MSVSPSPRHRSVIVARLRAAGCVFAEDEARLLISAARTPDDLAAMVDRRGARPAPLERPGGAGGCGRPATGGPPGLLAPPRHGGLPRPRGAAPPPAPRARAGA